MATSICCLSFTKILSKQDQCAPAAPALIRRGPNNGGFFYDILCLILSFVMSLIPAWKPDDYAQPEVEEAGEEGEQRQQQDDVAPDAGDNVDENAVQ